MTHNSIFSRKRGIKITKRLVFFLFSAAVFFLALRPALAEAPASISGKVYNDLNINNAFSINEPGLAGWEVSLIQGGKVSQTAATAGDGSYSFANLSSGDYRLRINVPKTWAATGDNDFSVRLSAGEQVVADIGAYLVIGQRSDFQPIMQIASQSIQVISATEVKVIWFTNHLATGQVVFGPEPKAGINLLTNDRNFGYADSSAVDFNVKTYHEIILKNLKPQTTYYFRIVSLPDPRQWGGAAYLLGEQAGFTTGRLEAAVSQNQGQKAKPAAFRRTGKILAEELSPEELAQIEEATNTEAAAGKEAEDAKQTADNCTIPLWVLIIANIIAIILLWNKNKEGSKPSDAKLWWIMLILVTVPVILGYPECWLTIWLILTLIMAILALTNKKNSGTGSGQIISSDAFDFSSKAGKPELFEPKKDGERAEEAAQPPEKPSE